MRVIAGSAKGVALAPVPRGVRPVSDMAREGVFSSLAADVPGARVLDLYAGTGAMGIEALSRGAEHAVFVDRSRAARRAIRVNLQRTHLGRRATVVGSDVLAFVMEDDNPFRPFGLVFVDPPYATAPREVERVLEHLAPRWLAAPGWAVVLTRPMRGSPPVVPLDWRVARRLVYGDTLVLVFREA